MCALRVLGRKWDEQIHMIWKSHLTVEGGMGWGVEGETGDQEASAEVRMGNGEPLHKGGDCMNKEEEMVLRCSY